MHINAFIACWSDSTLAPLLFMQNFLKSVILFALSTVFSHSYKNFEEIHSCAQWITFLTSFYIPNIKVNEIEVIFIIFSIVF